MQKWNLGVIGYDTLTHQLYQPAQPKVNKQKNDFIIFTANLNASFLPQANVHTP